MGYGLSVFLVPREAARYVFGCRDSALLADILEQEQFLINDYDSQIFDEEDTEHFTHGQAIREIIEGNYSHPEVYHVYGWSFEIVCDYLGKRLSSDDFSPCSTGWLQKLDRYLTRRSVPLCFDDLIETCPVPLPPCTDWPCVGHWTGAQMRDAAQRLTELLPRVRDREARTALTAVNSWLYRATFSPETILVGFYGEKFLERWERRPRSSWHRGAGPLRGQEPGAADVTMNIRMRPRSEQTLAGR